MCERVSKLSIEHGGRVVNHSRAGPLRVVGKALQTLRCSSGFDEGLTPTKDGGTCLRRLSMFRKEVH